MVADWPTPQGWSFEDEAGHIEQIQAAISAIRNVRSGYQIQPSQRAPIVIAANDPTLRESFVRYVEPIERLASASEVTVVSDAPHEAGYVNQVVHGGTEVALRLMDLIDIDREHDRLSAEIEDTEGLLSSTRRKLDNQQFVAKAPPEVVNREREKVADLEATLKRLAGLRAGLEAKP